MIAMTESLFLYLLIGHDDVNITSFISKKQTINK